MDTFLPIKPIIYWLKISLLAIYGVIIVIVLVSIGIQIGKNQMPNKQLVLKNPTPTFIPTTDPTSNWKTYVESRELKFSIRYPSTWVVDTKDGMYGEKGARFESGKELVGSVGVNWNSQPVEPNCSTEAERKEPVQIKNRIIEMCHFIGSTQEPEGYFYNSSANGINYSIVTSNYPGEENRKMILKILSTLEI